MLPFIRYWLPAIVTIGGILVMVFGDFGDVALEGGAGVIGAGLSIWLMNVLFRVGLHDDEDRDREDAARDFYDANGHWPDEPPPPPHVPMGRRVTRPAAPAPHAPAAPERRIARDRGGMRPRRPT